MEATGADKDAPVLRALLDEALANRRRRAAKLDNSDEAPSGLTQAIEALQSLILKTISLGEKLLRIEGFKLKLLQETFAATHGTREAVWNALTEPALRNQGATAEALAARFELDTQKARESAYSLARIILQQDTAGLGKPQLQNGEGNSGSNGLAVELDDNQPMLF